MGRILLGGAVVEANPASLRKFFNRFSHPELIAVGKMLIPLSATDLALPKSKLTTLLIGQVGKNITYDQVALVDTHYVLTCNNKKWETYQMLMSTGEPHKPSLEAAAVQNAISTYLSSFFDVHAFSTTLNGSLWTRIFLQDGVKPASQLTGVSNTIFMVQTPFSNAIFLSPVKVALHDFIMPAVVHAFGCHKVSKQGLSGRNLGVLQECFLNQDSQGPYAEYRALWHDTNPLDREAPTKRRRTEPVASDGLHTHITLEDLNVLEAERDAIDDSFGGHPAAALNFAEYSLDVPFQGSPELALSGRFKAKVKFEGPSIVDGLPELVKAGAAVLPLPDVLTSLNSSGANKFVISETHSSEADSSEAHNA